MNYTDWIGFTGVFLILLAFLLNILGVLRTKSLIYIILNLLGASLAFLASILLDYMPFIILEGAWALVSLVALLRFSYLRKKENKKKE